MATILEFPVSSESSPASTKGGLCRSAEIVVFPGVRYEHWEEAQSQSARAGRTQAKASAKIKRDTLLLIE